MATERMDVKPLPGMICRDPITLRALPDDKFTSVPRNSYWNRRVLAGDVIKKGATATAEPKKPKADK